MPVYLLTGPYIICILEQNSDRVNIHISFFSTAMRPEMNIIVSRPFLRAINLPSIIHRYISIFIIWLNIKSLINHCAQSTAEWLF